MQQLLDSDAGMLYLFVILFIAILSIMMIIAILKIPKIAKYNRAQMELTALMAQKNGISSESIESILIKADENLRLKDGLIYVHQPMQN